MSLQLILLSVQSIRVIGLSSADAELQSAPSYPAPPEFECKCVSIGVTIRINTEQIEAKGCVSFFTAEILLSVLDQDDSDNSHKKCIVSTRNKNIKNPKMYNIETFGL